MRSKVLLNLFAVAFVIALSAVAALAQVATASGKVMLKQADGTTVPVQGATVKFYRTDINQEFNAKTDKSGRYVNVGIPLTGTYTIAVSGPGIRPDFIPGIRISQQPENNFTLEPGDGTVLTLDQIKAGRAAAAAAGGGAVASAEAKKRADELEKKRKEIEDQNKKATDFNAQANGLLKSGNEAFNANKFAEAISFYDQGSQLAPEEPVFHRNKATALYKRGVEKYLAAAALKDAAAKTAGKEEARTDFKAAIEEAEKAVGTLKTRTAGGSGPDATAAGGASPQQQMLDYMGTRTEAYRLASQTDTQIDADVAIKAIQEYVAVETDATKKAEGQTVIGDVYFNSGRVAEAITMYREILTAHPDTLNAMRGLGIALTVDPTGPKYEEARTLLQQFADKAPATNPRKQEAVEMAKYLEDTEATTKKSKEPDTKPKTPARRRP